MSLSVFSKYKDRQEVLELMTAGTLDGTLPVDVIDNYATTDEVLKVVAYIEDLAMDLVVAERYLTNPLVFQTHDTMQ